MRQLKESDKKREQDTISDAYCDIAVDSMRESPQLSLTLRSMRLSARSVRSPHSEAECGLSVESALGLVTRAEYAR